MSAAVALLAVPALLGRIVDTVVTRGTAGAIDVVALGILAALVARALLAALGSVLVARLGERIPAGLRERVLRRAPDVPLADVEQAGSGDLVARVGGDIAVISDGIRRAVPLLVIAVLDVALTLVGLAVPDWRLAPAGPVPLPTWVLATRWYVRTSGPLHAADRVAEGARTQTLLAGIGGAGLRPAGAGAGPDRHGLRRGGAGPPGAQRPAATTRPGPAVARATLRAARHRRCRIGSRGPLAVVGPRR